MSDSSLVPFDKQLAEVVKFAVDVSGELIDIEFQFAPKITSESNSSKWIEVDSFAIEPIRLHKGASGRKVTIEWEYIATDSNQWNGKTISENLRNLKSYNFKFKPDFYPLVRVKYMHVLPEITDFRMEDVNITYSPELVFSGGDFYPLHTKVIVNLSLATSVNVKDLDAEQKKMAVQPLQPVIPEWY